MPARPSKYKDHLLWPAVALFILCVVTTAALAGTNALTAGPIDRQAALAAEEARKAVLDAATFDAVDLATLPAAALETAEGPLAHLSFHKGTDGKAFAYVGRSADGTAVGVVVTVDTRGYASGLQVMVGVAADGTVAGIRILADNETPGLGKKVREAAFLSGFLGKAAPAGFAVRKDATGDEVAVDAVTGATISSRAVVQAVDASLRLAALLQKGGS